MSKPSYVPSGLSTDCGGYFGSVETTSLPAFRILSSRPPATGAVLAAAVASGVAAAVAPVLAAGVAAAGFAAPPPQAATSTVATPSMVRRPRRDIRSSFDQTPRGSTHVGTERRHYAPDCRSPEQGPDGPLVKSRQTGRAATLACRFGSIDPGRGQSDPEPSGRAHHLPEGARQAELCGKT